MEHKQKGMQHASRCWTEADVELQKPGNQRQKPTANDGGWTSPTSCRQESLSTEVLTSQSCSYNFWCFLLEYQCLKDITEAEDVLFSEAFIREQSGLNIKSGRPTSKGYNIEADFELKQLWNFKNQKTNDKRQRQMMGTNESNVLPTTCEQQTCVHQ